MENYLGEYYVFGEREELNKILSDLWSDEDGYMVGKDCENGWKMIRLNRLLMNFPEGKIVDHIDRNISNYCRNNLRIVDNRNSAINKNPRSDKKTSDFIGVSYSKTKDRWIAKISPQKGKEVFLGSFKDEISALVSRLNAEKKYYGEFAPQKHLFSEYGIE